MGIQQYSEKGKKWNAAFKTNSGLFEPTVMFFGMTNSPATFQSMMDSTFEDMIMAKHVIIYMDDILIFAQTQEELEKRTKAVLQKNTTYFSNPRNANSTRRGSNT